MTPQELKNSILQLAIQGKLVEQRPEEGTAEELFVQIQEEKQRLIKEKKIRKAKPLPEIDEDEKAFDLPVSWKWCRLGDILYKLTDGTHSTPRYVMHGVPFLSVKDMSSGKLDFSRCKYISEQEHQELYSRCNPELGDLLVTKVGTTGIPVIVDTDLPFSLFVSVALLKFNQHLIYNKFLQILINAPLVQKQVAENTRGVGNKNWVMRDIANTIVVLPPLAEQKRIVDKIEKLLPYFDRYEQAWGKLEKFNGRFPEDMKKSLLQYAIQGKLVEQRPEEGTAEKFFEQIQKEKQRLIAEKKIKKEKSLPEITDDEKPFDIPESWKWVRLGDITSKLTDGSHNPPPNTGSGYPVISAKNVKDGVITFENVNRFTDDEGFNKENSRTNIIRGDIIMGIIGGSIGNVAIYTHDKRVIAQRSIAIMRFLINIEFSRILLESPLVQNKLMISTSGSAQGGVYLGSLKNLPIPLPPLPEQKRIVEKIEQLLPLCEKLK